MAMLNRSLILLSLTIALVAVVGCSEQSHRLSLSDTSTASKISRINQNSSIENLNKLAQKAQENEDLNFGQILKDVKSKFLIQSLTLQNHNKTEDLIQDEAPIRIYQKTKDPQNNKWGTWQGKVNGLHSAQKSKTQALPRTSNIDVVVTNSGNNDEQNLTITVYSLDKQKRVFKGKIKNSSTVDLVSENDKNVVARYSVLDKSGDLILFLILTYKDNALIDSEPYLILNVKTKAIESKKSSKQRLLGSYIVDYDVKNDLISVHALMKEQGKDIVYNSMPSEMVELKELQLQNDFGDQIVISRISTLDQQFLNIIYDDSDSLRVQVDKDLGFFNFSMYLY